MQAEEQEMRKNDERIREMWEAIKYTNKHVVEVPE